MKCKPLRRWIVPLLCAALPACAAGPCPDALAHHVYLELREPDQAAIQELTADCRNLGSIPGVLKLSAGPRAVEIRRDRNDQAFHVALHLLLADDAAFAAYLVHPAHQELLARWGPRIAAIRVFDYRPGR